MKSKTTNKQAISDIKDSLALQRAFNRNITEQVMRLEGVSDTPREDEEVEEMQEVINNHAIVISALVAASSSRGRSIKWLNIATCTILGWLGIYAVYFLYQHFTN